MADVKFEVIHTAVNAIGFSNSSKIHDYYTYSNLLDLAISVKNRDIFSNVDIPNYSLFTPFEYQKNAVKLMLEKFEGRGVFGDQVGLGKTIQVLMTADVMYKAGAISNCVIVCPKTLVDQWKNEIATKFAGTFNVIQNDESSSVNFLDNIMKLFDEKIISADKLNIVFVDSDKFKSARVLGGEQAKIELIARCHQRIDECESEIKNIKDRRKEIIKANDRQIQVQMVMQGVDTPEEVYHSIPQIVELDNRNAVLDKEITELRERIINLEHDRLFNKPIDLLVIDESHKVINQINQSDYADLFTGMERTYTILLSATPIEKSVDDIYDLIRFVDKTRFTDIDRFHSYIYNAKTLNELIDNPKSLERMNGLINSLFTRKRLMNSDVMYSLTRKIDLKYLVPILDNDKAGLDAMIVEETDPDAKNRLVKLSNTIFDTDHFKQDIQTINDYIFESTYPFKMDDPTKVIPVKNLIKSDFIKLFLNSYICNCYKEHKIDFLYDFITWAPDSKAVTFVNQKEYRTLDKNQDKAQGKYIINLMNKDILYSVSKVIIYKANNNDRLALLEQMSEEFKNRVILCDFTINYFKKIIKSGGSIGSGSENPNMGIRGFVCKVLELSHLDKDDKEEFLLEFDKRYKAHAGETEMANELHTFYKNFVLEQFNKSKGKMSNLIFLMDYTRFEGSDLHAASQLILCQTDMRDESFASKTIDPLTLEQFVGRIYRIGQPSKANIVVFPEDEKTRVLFEEIYDDEKGLDIFGKGKNEIGFVVPAVIEKWKQSIETANLIKDTGYQLGEVNSFVDAFRVVYRAGELKHNNALIDNFKISVEKICAQLSTSNNKE